MIFLTLENPRAGCKKRTSLFRVTKASCHYNSTEYTENILIKKYGLPELLPWAPPQIDHHVVTVPPTPPRYPQRNRRPPDRLQL